MLETDKYPWHRMKAGESFFVPSLDPQVTILEGRKAAEGRKVLAYPAVYAGMRGVMFRLRR